MTDRTLQFSLGFITLCQIIKDTCNSLRKNFNLSENEVRILITIYSDKPQAVNQISKKFLISPAHTSKILNSLEQKELITRQLNGNDKRFEIVLLTEKGIRITCLIIEFIQQIICNKVINIFNASPVDLFTFSETIQKEIIHSKQLMTNISNN